MNESFNMSTWRRKYVLVAENDSSPENNIEYIPEKYGKIESLELVEFEPKEDPFNVIFVVSAEKDLKDAKTITVPFVKVEEWADEEELRFDSEEEMSDAATKYFDRYYAEYMTDEAKRAIHRQLYETKEEAPAKKPTRTEVVDQIKHFLQEKY